MFPIFFKCFGCIFAVFLRLVGFRGVFSGVVGLSLVFPNDNCLAFCSKMPLSWFNTFDSFEVST